MVKKTVPLSILVLLSSILFFSCDSFFIGPSMNLNWEDPEVSFGRLKCEVIDSDEVRVIWDWYDIERALRGLSSVYDEIVIKHSSGSYPFSRLGGKSFTLKGWDASADPSTSAVFTDLKRDREHYFALYAHETGGGWMAPVYTSEYLDSSYPNHWFDKPLLYHAYMGNLNGNTYADIYRDDTYTLYIANAGVANDSINDRFHILLFDLGDYRLQSAFLTINVFSIPMEGATLYIYPLRFNSLNGTPQDIVSLGNIDNLRDQPSVAVDRSIRTEYPLSSAGIYNIDITNVWAKSHYHRSGGLFLSSDGGEISLEYTYPDSDPNYPNLEVEIMENY